MAAAFKPLLGPTREVDLLADSASEEAGDGLVQAASLFSYKGLTKDSFSSVQEPGDLRLPWGIRKTVLQEGTSTGSAIGEERELRMLLIVKFRPRVEVLC